MPAPPTKRTPSPIFLERRVSMVTVLPSSSCATITSIGGPILRHRANERERASAGHALTGVERPGEHDLMARRSVPSAVSLWTLADDEDMENLRVLEMRARSYGATPPAGGPDIPWARRLEHDEEDRPKARRRDSYPPRSRPGQMTSRMYARPLQTYGYGAPPDAAYGPPRAPDVLAKTIPLVLVLVAAAVGFFLVLAHPAIARSLLAVVGGLAAIAILAAIVTAALDWLIGRGEKRRHRVNVETEEPLDELEKMARSHAARLHGSHRIQTIFACAVFVLLMALLAWGAVLVTLQRTAMGAFFGSGGVGGGALLAKWQPFDRINTARDQANAAEALAFGFRERLKTIREIPDPKERQAIQWQATKEFMEEARNPLLPPHDQTKKKTT